MGLLSMGPMSGYDIKKRFETITSNFWSESYGQIYPILKRLKNEGLATQSIKKQKGKPDRHIYELTSDGEKELTYWLKEPVEPQVGRHEILLKLIFGTNVSTADNMAQVGHFRQNHVRELKALASIKANMKTKSHDDPHLPYWMMTVRFGELVNEALLQWCDEAIVTMENIKGDRDGN